jgi:hypothetical protein
MNTSQQSFKLGSPYFESEKRERETSNSSGITSALGAEKKILWKCVYEIDKILRETKEVLSSSVERMESHSKQ